MSPKGHLPVIATERLLLRVPTEADARAMLRLAEDNRDHFEKWDPARDEDYFTLAHWQRQLADHVAAVRAGTFLQFAIVLQDKSEAGIIGQCTLAGVTRGAFQAAYLGYGLDHRYQGQGYMSEALRALIAYAFGEMNLHRIMANYMPDNVRSERLLTRLGFEREGFAHDYLYLAGRWRDHVLTSLTNPDWTPE